MPQADKKETRMGGTGNRGVLGFKARTALKNITDGTSKTFFAGEVGKYVSEGGHAFNGDHNHNLQLGWRRGFCQKCTLTEAEGGDNGFGSAHPAVANFAACDGSIRAVSKDTDLGILDRLATRAGDDPYDIDGTSPTCP